MTSANDDLTNDSRGETNRVGQVRPLWRDFLSRTTLHGTQYACVTKPLIRRVTWLLLLLGMVGYFGYLFYGNLKRYHSHPVEVTVEIETPNDGIGFPAVSVCTNNKYMKSKINMLRNHSYFHKLGLDIPECAALQNVSGNMTCGQALMCAIVGKYGYIINERCKWALEKIRKIINDSDYAFDIEKFTLKYGHDIKALLTPRFCTFRGKPCNEEDFVPVITSTSLCWTFNSGFRGSHGNPAPRKQVTFSGVDFGLTVLLNTRVDENTIGTSSEGVRAVVHEPGEYFSVDHGVNVMPGAHAAILVHAQKTTTLPLPYKSNCTESKPGLRLYSMEGCVALCASQELTRRCGCRPVGLPYVDAASVCSFKHETCAMDTFGSFDAQRCMCNNACHRTMYNAKVSYARFPDQYIIRFIQETTSYNYSAEYFRRNLVLVQVGMESLSYEHHRQVPAFPVESLLGAVGGHLGLLLGCSVLTVFEFIDFFIVALASMLRTNVTPNMDRETKNL
ncbi:predicted protein [Nematostella vectensis]|uniref:Uncharacterized protein n=1 Tax=Nematostella vectensis TaxID=45351 RepID=A7SH56_NEMVE|nr:acid-sensing ion channel 2 [Nematostella vectensis]EDO36962.1 predicted protein [Nematostella vectensis]|eukprot:XP_001629025.1 predicted protein [Nematostella vectensis]